MKTPASKPVAAKKPLSKTQKSAIARAAALKAWKTMRSASYKRAHAQKKAA